MVKPDNSTIARKVSLRLKLLQVLGEPPVICEAYGGTGRLFEQCYGGVTAGVVCELDELKAEALAQQRPSWSVYQGDVVSAIAGGAGAHLLVNLLDCDPYGEPWPLLDAWFTSERPRAKRLAVAVNDGLRIKLKTQSGYTVKSLAAVLLKYGNAALYANYLAICKELVEAKAAQAGYTMRRWTGYYTGTNASKTHYAALLEL